MDITKTYNTEFNVFRQYDDQIKRCMMLPEDINAYINASCSMIGAMEYLMIDVREQLKGVKQWRQGVKYYGNLTLEVIDNVVTFADKSTDEKAFDLHISDIEVFRRMFVREGLNLRTSVRLIYEVATLAMELCNAVTVALDNVNLRSPITNRVMDYAIRLNGFSRSLEQQLEKTRQPMIWPSIHGDLRNILYEIFDRRA